MDGDMISLAKYTWFWTKIEKESIWQATNLQKYEFSSHFKPDSRMIMSVLDFLAIFEKRFLWIAIWYPWQSTLGFELNSRRNLYDKLQISRNIEYLGHFKPDSRVIRSVLDFLTISEKGFIWMAIWYPWQSTLHFELNSRRNPYDKHQISRNMSFQVILNLILRWWGQC